ncbi:MAG: twin-arginine translocase subunit TatC [Bacteroidaceae bacterium]|nr:twin-arginine translocase subunit TatC [Bacteroidaceae bacterium]
MTFWDHLDELRSVLLRCLIATAVVACLAFVFKDEVFSVVLAPKDPAVQLINTELTSQFVIHMMVSFYVGLLVTAPYLLFEAYRFIAPALYQNEKRYATHVILSGYLMFMLGAAFNYFVVFPITFRFLGNYQVSDDVDNMISLQSYIDTLMVLSLMMGVVFEIPVVTWLLGKMGIVNGSLMRQYRRHAIVLIVVVAAIITPTSDAFTLAIVSVPMYLLYEVSIWLVKRE